MRKTVSFFIFALFAINSCTVDYDIPKISERVPDRIVINGFLTPMETVKIAFGVVSQADGGYVYRAANGVKVRLTEDGNVVYDGICEDTLLTLDYQPKTTARYRIEASLDGYGTASAETSIPEAITGKIKYKGKTSQFYNENLICYLYDCENYGKNNQSALYISYYTKSEGDTLMEINSLYSKDLLIDNLNRVGGMPILDEEVGSLYFDNYMRIKRNNIPLIDTLVFAPEYAFGDGVVRLLTAGDDYDTYMRTFYEQTLNVGYDDISGAFVRLVHVYSNVSGGYGIFAGYNEIFNEIAGYEENENNF
ncbi:MAG: DUF4249 domain-containing protein [Tannerella sp.]|jgi:hypothetical protein|nr:DUF4249 domain-containing protein [Tannerella sp.]